MGQRSRAMRLSSCAMMCAMIAVCAQITLPLPGVPMNLALFAVHLSALLLGGARAATAALAYLLLGACGAPVFAGFASGPAALLGPTGGFLLSYPLCALLTGSIARPGAPLRRAFAAALCGACVSFACGVPWFMVYSSAAPTASFFLFWLVYLPGDALKAFFAALLARRLRVPLRRLGL